MKVFPLALTLVVGVVVLIVGPGLCTDDASTSDIEIVGLGDNCGGQSVCDLKSHLTCVNLKCHCNFRNGFVLDDAGVGCILTENSDELADYQDSLEEDDSSLSDDHDSESNEDDHDATAEDKTAGDKGTQWPEDENEWELPENNTGSGMQQDQAEAEDDIHSDEETQPAEVASDPKTGNVTSESAGVVDVAADTNAIIPPKIDDEINKIVPQPRSQPEGQEKEGPNHDDSLDDFWQDDDEDDQDYSWEAAHEHDDDNGDVPNSRSASCSKDADCTGSSLGQFSICHEGSCECSDTKSGTNRKTVLHNGTCFVWRELDSECTSHEECDAVISGPAWCHTDKSSATSFCTCRPFHIWDEDRKECLPLATSGVGSPCQNDDQCSAVEALGPFSKCSEVTGTCECRPGLGPNAKRVISFGVKCMEVRDLGEDCESDQECQASLGSSSNCHPLTRTCSCRPGQFCSQMLVRPAMSGFTLLVLIALCVSIGLGSVLCFVFRRRGGRGEAYSFIQQQNDV